MFVYVPALEPVRLVRKLFKPKTHIETANNGNYVVLGTSDEVNRIVNEAQTSPGNFAVFTVQHLWIKDRVAIPPEDITSIRPH